MDKIDHVAASEMVSASMLAALVARLRRIGVLSAEDEREPYEHALLLLEEQSAIAPPEMQPILKATREVVEEDVDIEWVAPVRMLVPP
ncbi:hypothetical protein [Bosea thiooxidans]|nr:hypothetical protein [Bosea thiooxidans]